MRNLDLPGRSAVLSLNGMVATSHPLSTQAALRVLAEGGNAMDAAITASAVQSVVEPQSTGIGGDCFCLVAPKGGGEVKAFNGSGRAPAAAKLDWFLDQGMTEIGTSSPHAVTIPGAIDAWDRLLKDHGTMSLGDALRPAIGFARDGYPILHRVYHDWALAVADLKVDANAAAAYLVDGKAPAIGTVQRQPALAATLETLAREGRDAFYSGALAEDMVAYLRGLGGLHTLDDFAAAKGEYVTPVSTEYRGYRLHECPPNGQGITALAMLNTLSGFDFSTMEPNSAERQHLLIEAARLAYRDRDAQCADPAMADVPVDVWLSEAHAAKARAAIDPDRAMDPLPPSDFPLHKDTVIISVVDKDRNAVSFINSLFHSFGACRVAPKSGITLHNRGTGFRLVRGHPNAIAPNKRPLHTIIPAMLTKDDHAVMPFGVMGGHYQAFGHAALVSNLLDYGMDLQSAIDQPRVFSFQGAVQVESGVSAETRAGLEARGHTLVTPDRPLGGAQAIWIDHEAGTLIGGSDGRKDGGAIGY